MRDLRDETTSGKSKPFSTVLEDQRNAPGAALKNHQRLRRMFLTVVIVWKKRAAWTIRKIRRISCGFWYVTPPTGLFLSFIDASQATPATRPCVLISDFLFRIHLPKTPPRLLCNNTTREKSTKWFQFPAVDNFLLLKLFYFWFFFLFVQRYKVLFHRRISHVLFSYYYYIILHSFLSFLVQICFSLNFLITYAFNVFSLQIVHFKYRHM